MKIGLSLSRCVKDIVDGIIDINEVLVIISRTDFDPRDDQQWKEIWEGYAFGNSVSYTEWAGYTDETQFRQVCLDLWNTGKLHQPRQFGCWPGRRSSVWLETVLPNSELENNPTAKQAWDTFQTIAGLTNVALDKEYK